MWISGLVVTLPEQTPAREQVLVALRTIECLELGDLQATCRQPIVMETEDIQLSQYWYQWIEQLPGVQKVDMAWVTFDMAVE